ncbi:MAG: hypothetical protein H7145_10115, partial [Akkermansiaceae bacterium]|nr:hypothetical protein [Armatimonadota bacterium]
AVFLDAVRANGGGFAGGDRVSVKRVAVPVGAESRRDIQKPPGRMRGQ